LKKRKDSEKNKTLFMATAFRRIFSEYICSSKYLLAWSDVNWAGGNTWSFFYYGSVHNNGA